MAAPGQPRAPVATGGFLMLLWAFYSYNFIYSRFPPTARSGPSSPSRARLSSSSSGCFLGRKGIRDRYREEPFPRTPFLASVREAHFPSSGRRLVITTTSGRIYRLNCNGGGYGQVVVSCGNSAATCWAPSPGHPARSGRRTSNCPELLQFRHGACRYGGSRARRTPDHATLDQIDVFRGKR